MNKWVVLLIGISSFMGVVITGFAQQSDKEIQKAPKNIILVGWDGAQRNHVKEALQKGELPNLQSLIVEGTIVAIDILRTTDTKAGWAQILTGYEPEITGVFSDSRYGPIPEGYTIFERLEIFFGDERFITAAIIAKKGNIGANGPKLERLQEGKQNMFEKLQRKIFRKNVTGEIVEKNGEQYIAIPAEPYYFTQSNVDVFLNGLGVNEHVGSKALELLEQYQNEPFFFFVHFAEVDMIGHLYGENSQAYHEALISSDAWTGKIIRRLKDLGLYEDTVIYVTADHGFDEGLNTHQDAPYVFLATNDPAIIRRGERADIAPTILERFGLDVTKIEPLLSGHPLTRPYDPPLW